VTPDATHLYERRRWTRQRWTFFIAGFLACFGLGLAYARWVESSGDWSHGLPWERSLMYWVHDHPFPFVIDKLMLVFPWFGTNITLIPGVALVAWWVWARAKRRHLAVQLIVVQVGSYLLNPSLKALVDRARPAMFQRRGWYGWSSDPSGHAIASVAVLMTVALILHRVKGWRWPYYVAGLIMVCSMYSRIYLAVHWPTDVIAGAIVGAAWLALTAWAFREHFSPVPDSALTPTPTPAHITPESTPTS
jgi:membrane-associated phospholipid phosphatase